MFPHALAFIALYCFSIACSFAQSQVIASAAPGQRDIRTSNGQPVPNGNSVWIGSFEPRFNAVANGANLPALLLHWSQYGSTLTTTILGQGGRFSTTSASTDPNFDNQKIWLWMFHTVNNSAPAVDFSNVTEYGLFSSTLQNWHFPSVNTPPPSNVTTINTLEINQTVYGAIDPLHVYLTPVPEPSIGHILCLFAAVVLKGLFKRERGASI